MIKDLVDKFCMCILVNIKIIYGIDGFIVVVIYFDLNFVLSFVVGVLGLFLIIEVLKVKKDIVIVNKEILVVVGYIVIELVK